MKNEDLLHAAQWAEMEARLGMSKRDIEAEAQHQLEQIWEAGETDEFKLLAISARNKTFWDAFEQSARAKVDEVPEKNYKAFGCEFSMMNTGDRKDYEQDTIYKQIAEQLKQRKELLDLAFKSKNPIYDEHGCEVPKVGIKTYGKETLKIKY